MALKPAISKEKIIRLVKDLDLSHEYEVPDCDIYVLKGKSSAGNTRLQVVIGLHDETGKRVRVRKSITLLKDEVRSRKNINDQVLIIKSVLVNELARKLKEVNYSLFIPTFEEYVKSKRGKLRDTTVDAYEYRANAIVEYFSQYPDITVEQITPLIITKFIKWLEENKQWSYRTVKDTHALLFGFFKSKMRIQVISSNPCKETSDAITKPRKNVEDEFNFLSVEEFDTLIGWLDTHQEKNYYILRDMFEFGFLYGLRKEEVLAIQYDAIDLETNHLIIKRTRVKGNKVYDFDDVKTKSSYRSYPMTDKIIDIIKKNRKRQLENNEISTYLFHYNKENSPKHVGEAYKPDYISRLIYKMRIDYYNETGFDLSWFTWHMLRHSCISNLSIAGWTLQDIAEWVGHADIETTKEVYLHFQKDWKDEKIKKLDNIWNNNKRFVT